MKTLTKISFTVLLLGMQVYTFANPIPYQTQNTSNNVPIIMINSPEEVEATEPTWYDTLVADPIMLTGVALAAGIAMKAVTQLGWYYVSASPQEVNTLVQSLKKPALNIAASVGTGAAIGVALEGILTGFEAMGVDTENKGEDKTVDVSTLLFMGGVYNAGVEARAYACGRQEESWTQAICYTYATMMGGTLGIQLVEKVKAMLREHK